MCLCVIDCICTMILKTEKSCSAVMLMGGNVNCELLVNEKIVTTIGH